MGEIQGFKDLLVLSQRVDPETGASLVPYPTHYGEGVSPIPTLEEREKLEPKLQDCISRGIRVFDQRRPGTVLGLGDDRFEYRVVSLTAFNNKAASPATVVRSRWTSPSDRPTTSITTSCP